MVYVTLNEEKLVKDLTEFTEKSYDMLRFVCYGMEFSESVVCSEHAKKDISNMRAKVDELSEIILSFKIGIDTKKQPNKLWIVWNKTGSSDKYYYRDDKVLTEKMLSFIIMTFEKEINKKLSIIEAANNHYSYFGSRIKDPLHKIIMNYMTA